MVLRFEGETQADELDMRKESQRLRAGFFARRIARAHRGNKKKILLPRAAAMTAGSMRFAVEEAAPHASFRWDVRRSESRARVAAP